MLEEKEVQQYASWKQTKEELSTDERFRKAPEDLRREWYMAYLKTCQLEGNSN